MFRLSKAEYSRDLSEKGAEKAGGKWNSKGIPLIYTAESRALCTVELAVHLSLDVLPDAMEMVTLEVPDEGIADLDRELLPVDRNALPLAASTQQLGNDFIAAQEALALKVPSAVVEGDCNILINPRHPELNKVKIVEVKAYELGT